MILINLFFPCLLLANVFVHGVPLTERPKRLKKSHSSYLAPTEKKIRKSENTSPYLPPKKTKKTYSEKPSLYNPESGNNTAIQAESKKELEIKGENNVKNSLAISLFKDSYNYNGPTKSIFDDTFRSSNSSSPLLLLLEGRNKVWDFLGMFQWGINAGVGHNSGSPKFANGVTSEFKVQLWSFSLEAALEYVFNFKYFTIALCAGPGVTMLYQNRSDKENSEEGKRFYQWSPGYFAQGSFNLNFAKLFPRTVVSSNKLSNVVNYYLSIKARMVDYRQFQTEGIEMTGLAIGGGLVVEYF